MKLKLFYSIFFLLLFSFSLTTTVSAQRTCGTDHYMEEMLKDPAFAKKFYKEREKALVSAQQKALAPCTNPLIIPVAVHYNTGVTNADQACLIEAAQQQIAQLNLDFSSCNANAGNLCTWINAGCDNFGGTAGADAMPEDGACMVFCLADQNLPAGEDNIGGFGITVGDYTWSGGVDAPTWSGYMNIFVGTYISGGILGVAPLNGASNPNGNGVYVLASTFGATGFSGCNSGTGIGNSGTFSGGATATHEIGHYFGLEHTFSDNVADTPPQNNSNSGCPTVDLNNCTSSVGNDYSGNFMDYVDDDCMHNFSADQVAIMQTIGAPQNQWAVNSVSCNPTYASCNAGPCATGPPVAAFSPSSDITICPGSTITISDQSTNNPTQWSWSFSGSSNPSLGTSTVENPAITVANSGTLTISLTAMNNDGSDSEGPTTINVTVLPASDPMCQATPCTSTAANAGPYVDFGLLGIPNCATNCAPVSPAFQVWGNEGYVLGGLTGGEEYTFEFCSGYSAATWPANITVAPYDGATGTPGTALAWVNDCTITFTAPSDGDYVAYVSVENDCGGAYDQTDNGTPSLQCSGLQSTALFTDEGGLTGGYITNQTNTYTFCPDDPSSTTIEVNFTAFSVEDDPTCQYDAMTVYDGNGTGGTVIGTYCGANSPGLVTSSDASGCLTFVFVSDVSVTDAGWAATVSCVSDCGPALTLVGNVSGMEDNETDDYIESTQTIASSAMVDYDAVNYIDLNPGFCVEQGAEFMAFIDGCNNGAGGINNLTGNNPALARKIIPSTTSTILHKSKWDLIRGTINTEVEKLSRLAKEKIRKHTTQE